MKHVKVNFELQNGMFGDIWLSVTDEADIEKHLNNLFRSPLARMSYVVYCYEKHVQFDF